ncbi:MAG TPA: NUDIX hydrolase [Caulobacteraceae bacterium]|nr:NUDIX hydrolase [Caulobacteraceae bacterium]
MADARVRAEGASSRPMTPTDRTRPEILGRDTTHIGYVTVERLRVRLADGAEVVREVESHGDAIAVLPYDPERRAGMIVSLFRAPAFDRFGEAALEEACAGMIETSDLDSGGDEAGVVRREALEELGLRLGELEFVARVWSSPGVSAERVALYLAPYERQDRIGPGGGLVEEHEAITVIERSLAQLAADADAGRIADLKLFALVLALRARRPDLFEG